MTEFTYNPETEGEKEAAYDAILALPVQNVSTIGDVLTVAFEDWNTRRMVLESSLDGEHVVLSAVVTQRVAMGAAKMHLARLMEIENRRRSATGNP